jgi:hypothetical protein
MIARRYRFIYGLKRRAARDFADPAFFRLRLARPRVTASLHHVIVTRAPRRATHGCNWRAESFEFCRIVSKTRHFVITGRRLQRARVNCPKNPARPRCGNQSAPATNR